ncbi:MAG: alcohol dehydrogenase catalytic domain-containing protein [Actinobacteria bacterium]|nr:alcohol dehydrogenase catalytic domain-containing protein [Actinomycetota bacterium]
MQHLVYLEPGQVAWRSVDDPSPAADGVVVRPTAVARCDLDPFMVAFGLFPGPFPVGHEAAGEVVAVGDEVERWQPGDRVVVPFQVSCGSCEPCRAGRFAACEPHRARAGAAFGFGSEGGGHPGAVADLLAVPHADHLLLAAPDGVEDQHLAPAADNLADGWRAVVPALRAEPGADVLVVGGLGVSIGLYAIHAATAHGATGPYGTCTSVAIHFGAPIPLPLLSMYTRGITFHTSRADARRLLGAVLDEIANGTLDPGVVPTRVVDFDEAADAWVQPAIKLVVAGRE